MGDRNVSRRLDEENDSQIQHNALHHTPYNIHTSSHREIPESSGTTQPRFVGTPARQVALSPPGGSSGSSHEPCVSPSRRPGSLTRDSGYNTEASPATTCSPAVATPPRLRHFQFDDLEAAANDNMNDESFTPSHPSRPRSSTEPNVSYSSFIRQAHHSSTPASSSSQQIRPSLYERRNSKPTPTLRFSPEIFTNTSSDSTPVASADVDSEHRRPEFRNPGRGRSRINFDESGNFIGFVHSSSNESENEDDGEEEVFKSTVVGAERWGARPKGLMKRKGSFSLRSRRFCSDSEDDVEETGFAVFGNSDREDSNSNPHRGYSRSLPNENTLNLNFEISSELIGFDNPEDSPGACGGVFTFHSPIDQDRSPRSQCENSSLNSSQGFEPSNYYHEERHPQYFRRIHNSPSPHDITRERRVFTFDCLPHQLQASLNPGHRSAGPYTTLTTPSPTGISPVRGTSPRSSPSPNRGRAPPPRSCSQPIAVTGKPPRSPASRSSSRGRRTSSTMLPCLPSHVALPGGFRLPCLSTRLGQTASTQTPHQTCTMIQQIIDTPAALPNEARGLVAGRLRRLTEMGIPLPPSPVPLPDIVPLGRDRSLSVPDFQALARRQARATGQQVGRELRRLSDEFNDTYRRQLSPVYEEHQYSASYPGMAGAGMAVRVRVSRFAEFLRDTFGSPAPSPAPGPARPRRDSSVDGDLEDRQDTEPPD